jgi:hypothetical protein
MKYLMLSFLVPFLIVPAGAPLRTYQTSFPATEDPISDNNNWVNGALNGLDWGNVQTTPGHAFGTNINPGCSGSNPTACNDSVAGLTGTWAADQSACVVIFMGSSFARNSQIYEYEIHLHRTITAHNSSGYEFNYSSHSDGNQYMQIVRWNGALGSFKVLGGSPGVPVALNNGDTFCASSVGGVLKSWLVRAGATIQSTNPITDTTFTGGGPGVGFFNEGAIGDNANFGFSSFQATEINSGAPAPPTNLRVTGVQ